MTEARPTPPGPSPSPGPARRPRSAPSCFLAPAVLLACGAAALALVAARAALAARDAPAPALPAPAAAGAPAGWVDGTTRLTGVAMVVGGIITAIATGFFQPWLRERQTAERLADASRRLDALESANEVLRAARAAAEAREAGLIATLTDLTKKNLELTERNLRLAQRVLVATGRQRPGADVPPVAAIISDAGPPCDGPAVLLVEDAMKAREAIQEVLEVVAHARVEAVDTVAEALEALSRDPDVILLDLMLPDGDGVEVLRVAREQGRQCRVIVTTGKDESLLGEVRALGPFAVLHKPFDIFADVIPLLKKKGAPS